MKFLPIASLALVLALSGCASSPSVEEQTKLIEYENCLENAQERLFWIYEAEQLVPAIDYTIQAQLEDSVEEFEISLDACSKFRP